MSATPDTVSTSVAGPGPGPPRLHLTPVFYSVYLLQSVPKPQSFYVGSTPDPVRRLRQHNGILKAGGAYRTKRTGVRPWRVVALVHGFPSKVAALQFESALQHPHRTRHIPSDQRVTNSRAADRSVHQKLANVRLLVSSTMFRRMGLRVSIFDSNLYNSAWVKNRYHVNGAPEAEVCEFSGFFGTATPTQSQIPPQTPTQDGHDHAISPSDATPTQKSDSELIQTPMLPVESGIFPLVPSQACTLSHQIRQEDARFAYAKQAILATVQSCDVCSASIDYLPDSTPNLETADHLDAYLEQNMPLLALCYHLDCGSVTHLSCLAKLSPSTDIIPIHVSCQKCTRELFWPALVKTSTKLRYYALRDYLKNTTQSQIGQSRSQIQD